MFCSKVILFSLFVSSTFELSTLTGFFFTQPSSRILGGFGVWVFLMSKDSFNLLANFPHWGGGGEGNNYHFC